MKQIGIAMFEPTGNPNGVGGFEWRTDAAEAEKAFRSLRGGNGTATLWQGVEVDEALSPDEITDWVDGVYWDKSPAEQIEILGTPTKTHTR